MTTVVQIEDLSKHFVIRKEKSLKERVVNFGRSKLHKEDFWALKNVSLDIGSGSTIGLIGPNGSGKSTLLKMIGGILQPDTGSVQIRGRLAALLELGAGFHPDLTGRENVYLNASILGLSRKQIDQHFDGIVDFSGIEQFIDTQVKFYSSGMYVRLAFAVAVHVDPDILLVDEVLAVGDEPFQRKCLERIRQFQAEGRTIVLVTHSLDQVAQFCDRAVVLEHGAVVLDGTPRDALRTLRADFEETRQEEIARANEASGPATVVPRAKISGVALRSSSGELGRPTLNGSEGLYATFDITATVPLDDYIIGIAITTSMGTSIFGTDTKALRVPTPPLRTTNKYEVFLPELQLNEGEYAVAIGVALADGTELHRIAEAGKFVVSRDSSARGFLYVDAAFNTLAVAR